MHVLVDTNIIIPREHDWIVPTAVSDALRLFPNRGDTVIVHPASISELRKHRDARRRDVTLSKVKSYPVLQDPPNPDTDAGFRKAVGRPADANTDVDDRLLYAVVRNAVHILVTEDQGIHHKVLDIGVSARTFTISEAVSFLEQLKPKEESEVAPASVAIEPLHLLDASDPFFDSLRYDYAEFDDWLLRKSREGKRAWIHRLPDGQIRAFMLLKDESEYIELVGSRLPNKRRVKISTLKVTKTGYRLGELLLKIAFEYAVNNRIIELSLTIFSSGKKYLVSLIQQYGFQILGTNARREDVFLKRIRPPEGETNPERVFTLYYPCFYDGADVSKFVVPVQPQYHERLFPSWSGDQLMLDFEREMLPEGNAITKAYLCNSRIGSIQRGDLFLFYRSRDTSAITSIGIVERTETGTLTIDQVLAIAGKRIV